MRIAQIAPPWVSVPPSGYGGIEWVVQQLCDGLVERGHEVTLYATGDSQTKARLQSLFARQQPERMHDTSLEARHAAFALAGIAADGYDVMHDHTGFCVLSACAALGAPAPLVHTVHCAFDEIAFPFYEQFRTAAAFVSISDYQRTLAPAGMRWAGTVYNAVDVETWPFRERKDDYLLAFGRLCEAKGFHIAIEVARRSGHRLIMAGALQEAYRPWVEEHIFPQLDEQIVYLGEVDDARKRELFAGAKAFLFPVLWPEPFGLVMLEAMACGTPTIAFPDGAVREVIEDGRTGFVVADTEAMLSALARVDEIDPYTCRRVASERFGVGRMVEAYERIYAAQTRDAAQTRVR
jgi:glycosyltransferase involved in cell wall biosynthesis